MFASASRVNAASNQTVQRCVERALVHGPIEALEHRPRPGKEPSITAEAKAWLVALACRKPQELDYPHELSARAAALALEKPSGSASTNRWPCEWM